MEYPFQPDYLISNSCVYGHDPDFSAAEFLAAQKSPLLTWRDRDGRLAHEILDRAARREDLDARILVALLEREQSLVTGKVTPQRLDFALGFGCSDGKSNRNIYRGFAKQVDAAAKRLNAYEVEFHNRIKKPYEVDAPLRETHGKRFVKPVNMATLAMYIYCPHVGDRDLPKLKAPYGNLYLHITWCKFFGNPRP